jgi:site-specific DNA-methyltransferase (adenine-specific)
MQLMPDGCVDLTVTSPPYDDLKTYNGFSFPFEKIAAELFRVTAAGGVVVWVVGDGTKNGSESGTSFKQALHFMSLGFRLHDTMIYAKQNPVPLTHNRYEQQFEYMFILSKGKPKTFNGIREISKYAGQMASKTRSFYKTKECNTPSLQNKRDSISATKLRTNIWTYVVGSVEGKSIKHPAKFPELLAADHIVSWSNEDDLCFDPFGGSMTTAEQAEKLSRRWVSCEISTEFFEESLKRF